MKLDKQILAAGLLLASLLVGGCGSGVPAVGKQETPAAKPTEQQVANALPEETSSEPKTRQITVYFPTRDATYLESEIHTVAAGQDPLRTALELLIAGPESRDLTAIIPPGTALKNVWIKDHIAYVDFNDRLVKNNSGGSTAELFLVAAIVDTVTEFPDIAGVRILVEGKSVATIAGHVDVTETLGRSADMLKKRQ
jgi:germination protein M